MRFSIVIATYNRADILRDTLASLSRLRPDAPWEVIVVDNNSPDHTRAVVEETARTFPAPLVYLFERQQGRSAALNTGFAHARGDLIVTTDDDVQVEPDWLTRIAEAFDRHDCDYVGGRVLPAWQAPPPRWLPRQNGQLWAVIALLDYGDQPIIFGRRVPLGVNMAIRREALEHVGGFDARIGRKAGTLLGQEVREWCLRAHAAGMIGYYAPTIVVRHLIPRDRLTKRYFRRWFYWRGVSRALLYAESGLDMESPERTVLDFSQVPHIAGVPRYMFRSAAMAAKDAIVERLRGHQAASFERELWLWFFAGVVRQRWRDRQRIMKVATMGRWSEASIPIRATVSTTSADSSVNDGPGR